MNQLKKYHVNIYANAKEYKRLLQESAANGRSLSKTAGDCLNQYFAIKEELACSVELPGSPGDNTEGKIIHTLLARTEERMAATISRLEAKVSDLQEQLMVQAAMIEQMYLGLITHLPEIPEGMSDAAIASGKRRQDKWLKAVERRLQV